MEKELFHSTESSLVEIIIKDGFKFEFIQKPFNKTKKHPGSLGYGVYFFSDLELAKMYSKKKLNDGNILKANLKIDDDYILDLTNESELRKYNKFKEILLSYPIYHDFKDKFCNGKQSSLEGAMLEYLLQQQKNLLNIFGMTKVSCVVGMTVTQVDISDRSYLANGYEYCIKDRTLIYGVEKHEDWGFFWWCKKIYGRTH